jgi:hypothetical protein
VVVRVDHAGALLIDGDLSEPDLDAIRRAIPSEFMREVQSFRDNLAKSAAERRVHEIVDGTLQLLYADVEKGEKAMQLAAAQEVMFRTMEIGEMADGPEKQALLTDWLERHRNSPPEMPASEARDALVRAWLLRPQNLRRYMNGGQIDSAEGAEPMVETALPRAASQHVVQATGAEPSNHVPERVATEQRRWPSGERGGLPTSTGDRLAVPQALFKPAPRTSVLGWAFFALVSGCVLAAVITMELPGTARLRAARAPMPPSTSATMQMPGQTPSSNLAQPSEPARLQGATASSDDFCRNVVAREVQTGARNFPSIADQETIILAMTAQGCDVTTRYKLRNRAKAELPPDMLAVLKQRSIGLLCSSARTKSVFEHGGTYILDYRDKFDVNVGAFIIRGEDCKVEQPAARRPSRDMPNCEQLVAAWSTACTAADERALSDLYSSNNLMFNGMDGVSNYAVAEGKRTFFGQPGYEQEIFGAVRDEQLGEDLKCSFLWRVSFPTSSEVRLTREYPSYLVFRRTGGVWKIVIEDTRQRIAQ